MKKTLFLLVILSMVLFVSSCKRSEVDDPEWNDPAGFSMLVEGSANPAVLLIDGKIHKSTIYVRAVDSKGNPLAGKSIYLEQCDGASYQPVEWGYFENNSPSIMKVTNANGEMSAFYYWPTEWLSSSMYIHALMVIDGHSYSDSIPQDFISLTLIRSDNHENNGPVVNIIDPANNTQVEGNVNISALVVDAADGIQRVEFYIDGQIIGGKVGTIDSEQYSFNWDSTQYSNSRHTIKVVAIDNAGKSGEDSVSVSVNNATTDSPPVIDLIYPVDDPSVNTVDETPIYLTSNQINILVNAEDDRGVRRVDLYINNVIVGSLNRGGGTLYQLNWIVPSSGVYKFYAIAYDTINQMTKSDDASVHIIIP